MSTTSLFLSWVTSQNNNTNSLCYILLNVFVCLSDERLYRLPIAFSRRKNICLKKVDIIITAMTD